MTDPFWKSATVRNTLAGAVCALSAAALGAAVNVRDRVATCEAAQAADAGVRNERDAWVHATLVEIKSKLDDIARRIPCASP